MSIFAHPELFNVGDNFLWHRAPEYGIHGFQEWYAEEWQNLICVRSSSFKLDFADARASLHCCRACARNQHATDPNLVGSNTIVTCCVFFPGMPPPAETCTVCGSPLETTQMISYNCPHCQELLHLFMDETFERFLLEIYNEENNNSDSL